ncbi:lysozyme inhibitor LprI family protein [Maricaulis sp. CAU 1757]
MLSVFLLSVSLGASQLAPTAPLQPGVACAEHLTDWRARRSCLSDLLDSAESDMRDAANEAGQEAREIDLDTQAHFRAEASLRAAQDAWVVFRDAECARRSALMFVSEQSREEMGLSCRIELTRERTGQLEQS